ncbi:MAG: methyltransferase domain-containing protein [Bauldia sp.]|uniref:class I SAM-dependent methyltransferase n=1 Tax=Bauldia sp. TaxID=2575872 RepID=UPI001E1802E3|nr:class I SAM-dependent methyltransferase [Bauldia sp.]MCB1496192.1 methyltransferase domain-containing protein [Bauldia sp.]
MYLDVVDLRAFYAERLGGITRRLIGARLKKHWPSLAGDRLLGIGYATPYLTGLANGTSRTIAFMPAGQGVVNWPADGPNASALVATDALPLPDAAIDRVLVVHSLEVADNPREELREIWRVLAPGGRVILVVPNRRGIWTWAEKTPFGYGRPFTRAQLTTLLRESMFSPLGWSEALAAPPIARRPWLRTGTSWERIGISLWPAFAGVIIVEATKQLYRAIPADSGKLKPAFRPALVSPPAAAATRDASTRDLADGD